MLRSHVHHTFKVGSIVRDVHLVADDIVAGRERGGDCERVDGVGRVEAVSRSPLARGGLPGLGDLEPDGGGARHPLRDV